MSAPIRILVVCTGNLCRSPLAEGLLRRTLSDLPVVVTSAGTAAAEGLPMPPETLQWAEALGADGAQAHRARRFTAELAVEADLVLTAGLDHRRHVAEAAPKAVRRTFTLLEFAKLAESVEPRRQPFGEALVELAAQRPSTPLTPEVLEVADPYGGDAEQHRIAAIAIDAAVSGISAFIRGTLEGGR